RVLHLSSHHKNSLLMTHQAISGNLPHVGGTSVGLPGAGCRALCEDWRADIGKGHYGGLRIRLPTPAQSGVRHFADQGASVSPRPRLLGFDP
ncbi:hypothetical protein ACIGW6_38620, partial [Kitasatospora aureofaciens]